MLVLNYLFDVFSLVDLYTFYTKGWLNWLKNIVVDYCRPESLGEINFLKDFLRLAQFRYKKKKRSSTIQSRRIFWLLVSIFVDLITRVWLNFLWHQTISIFQGQCFFFKSILDTIKWAHKFAFIIIPLAHRRKFQRNVCQPKKQKLQAYV